MTKKRYVKLMMSVGYSRDRAVELAKLANNDGFSYEEAWNIVRGKTALKRMFHIQAGLSTAPEAVIPCSMLFEDSVRSVLTVMPQEREIQG